jgi:hypothetical protein
MSNGVVEFGRDSRLTSDSYSERMIGTLAPPTLGVLYTE